MKKSISAVGVIFEDEDGQVLVLRRLHSSREGNTWGLVGGNIDEGEDSLQTAIRETREEIGHQVLANELEFIKSYGWEHEDAFISFDVFRYKTMREQVDIQLDTDENTEHDWVLPKALHQRKDLMRGLYPIIEDLYEL